MRTLVDPDKQQEYIDKIRKVVVKYGDGSIKTFKPEDWYLFEDGISKMDVKIKIYYKESQSPVLLSEILAFGFGIVLFYNMPKEKSFVDVMADRWIILTLFIVLVGISGLFRYSKRKLRNG